MRYYYGQTISMTINRNLAQQREDWGEGEAHHGHETGESPSLAKALRDHGVCQHRQDRSGGERLDVEALQIGDIIDHEGAANGDENAGKHNHSPDLVNPGALHPSSLHLRRGPDALGQVGDENRAEEGDAYRIPNPDGHTQDQGLGDAIQ